MPVITTQRHLNIQDKWAKKSLISTLVALARSTTGGYTEKSVLEQLRPFGFGDESGMLPQPHKYCLTLGLT